MAAPNDDVTVIIGGQIFGGWQGVRITRACETMPPGFSLRATERNPATGSIALLPPGASCKVMIGADPVITGYVDRYMPTIGPKRHDIQIQGRGKTEDIVDCDITPDVLNGMQMMTGSLFDLAQKLCVPYRISVKSLTGDNVPVTASVGGGPLRFNANLQQTPFEILSEVANFAGVLMYEDSDGTLLLARVGPTKMASGFVQGVNIQQAAAGFTMDGRYQEYLPVLMSTNLFPGNVGGQEFPKAYDRGVPRFRQKIVVSNQFQFGQSFAELTAQWEAARRRGRSNAVRVTVDSWRDSAGTLWTPNAFAPIDVPALGLGSLAEPWVIASVDFIRDVERGTVADVVLMPKEAFQPRPTILGPNIPIDTPPPEGGGGATPGPTPAGGDGPIPGGAPGGSPGAPAALSPAGGGAAPTRNLEPIYDPQGHLTGLKVPGAVVPPRSAFPALPDGE